MAKHKPRWDREKWALKESFLNMGLRHLATHPEFESIDLEFFSRHIK